MNLLFFAASKHVIRTLFLSPVFLFLPINSAQACITDYAQFVLLDEIVSVLDRLPKQLNETTFRGNVKLTRVTTFDKELDRKIMVRAIVEESETHPHFVGKKTMFFYDTYSLCHYSILNVGDRGFAMGRALNFGSEILYVVPNVLVYSSGTLEILTESESIPLSELDPYWY